MIQAQLSIARLFKRFSIKTLTLYAFKAMAIHLCPNIHRKYIVYEFCIILDKMLANFKQDSLCASQVFHQIDTSS